MLLLRLNYIRKLYLRKLNNIADLLRDQGVTWQSVAIVFLVACLCVALVVNIYASIDRASRSYAILESERIRLEDIKSENQRLVRDLEYFSSLEYKRRYAYDSLNLTRPGEEIYIIDAGSRENYATTDQVTDPVIKDDHAYWWGTLWKVVWTKLGN